MPLENKKALEELRDNLINVRELCTQAIEDRLKMLDEQNGEISKMMSIAEQMTLSKEMMQREKERRKEERQKFQQVIKKF